MPLINIQTNLKSLTYGDFGAESPLVTKSIDGSATSSGLAMEVDKRVDDLTRITKLLTSTPAAVKFNANQAALNTLEQRIKSNKKGTIAGDILRGAGNTFKVLASTLAQVPVNGTGMHFVKGFAGKLGYLNGVQGHVQYRNEDNYINTLGKIEDNVNGDFTLNKSIVVLDYYSQKEDTSKIPKADKDRVKYGSKQFSDGQLSAYPQVATGSYSKSQTTGSYISTESGSLTGTINPKFQNDSIGFDEYRQPGEIADGIKPLDTITAKAPYTSSIGELNAFLTEKTGSQGPVEEIDDLIKFRFKIITPQLIENGEPKVTHLSFRAFLDSFSDSYGADWSGFRYIGRAEEFYTYSGFSRDISFSFKVAAFSKAEVTPLYNKLNLLAGHLAPTYVGSSFMRGNFAAITIGDYIVNQTGFFSSVDFSWNPDYQFGGRNEDSELPHILDVQCSFQPIHNFNVSFDENNRFLFPSGSNIIL